MGRIWPEGFVRVPDEEWTRGPVEELAAKYDSVERHGWYANLDPTVADLAGFLGDGSLLLDYSGGTGILAGRLFAAAPRLAAGVLVVDASPKFLRLAVEKLGDDERVAFRLIRYLKEERRLQFVQEVIGRPLAARGIDAVASTNAIHLYYDLDETLRSWRRLLRPGGRAFVQSGNVGLADRPPSWWIIDETVEAIHRAAAERVARDPEWAAYRPALADGARMEAYDALRRKFFLPVRPLDHYVGALAGAGFEIVDVTHRPIAARVDEWRDFLSAYHEGVLGWVGGSARIEGQEPSPAAVADRLDLLGRAMADVFTGRETFLALWTYLTAK